MTNQLTIVVDPIAMHKIRELSRERYSEFTVDQKDRVSFEAFEIKVRQAVIMYALAENMSRGHIVIENNNVLKRYLSRSLEYASQRSIRQSNGGWKPTMRAIPRSDKDD